MHRFSPALAGALAMVVCAFLWSTAGLFIKLIDWNPLWIAGIRSLIAGVFLLAIVRTVRLRWSWPLVAAAVANALCMILFVLANKLTTSANAILIQYWAPVATAILGVLVLKERLHTEQLAALVGTIGGLLLLFADKLSPGALWGNLAALASGLAFSLMFLFTRMQKDGDPLQSLMLSHFICAVAALGLAAFTPLPSFSPGLDRHPGSWADRSGGGVLQLRHQAGFGGHCQPDRRHRAGVQPCLGAPRPR